MYFTGSLILRLFILFLMIPETEFNPENKNENFIMQINNEKMETATLGAGCFWCVEAIYDQLEGVESVVSGYSGGSVKNPTYREVSSGLTGHAEVCQIVFDPEIISFEEILEVFWEVHDPTSLNRQGADIGTQYRSVIFYHSEKQKETAEKSKMHLDASGTYKDRVVTQIVPFKSFYEAEDYHQNYFVNNPNQPYCSVVISPKVKKFKKKNKDKLKKE